MIADDYPSQDPAVVATELFDAANVVAATYADVPAARGIGADSAVPGKRIHHRDHFAYHLHDIVHHAYDVTPRG